MTPLASPADVCRIRAQAIATTPRRARRVPAMVDLHIPRKPAEPSGQRSLHVEGALP
ncbi:MAG: hypothetical protein AAGN82_05925 [Myxococcota bacterium]